MPALPLFAPLALALVVGTPPAKLKQAQTLFLEGIEAGKEDRWKDALEKFQRSQEIIDRPSTAFNIGSALLHLQRFDEAVAAFEHFLVIADSDRDAALVRQAHEHIDEAKRAIGERAPPIEETTPPPEEPPSKAEPPKVERSEPPARAADTPDIDAKPLPAVKPAVEPESVQDGASRADRMSVQRPEKSAGVETEREGPRSVFESPVFWLFAGIVVVGAAVAAGVAIGSGGERAPYSGTSGTVLRGLQ